MSDKDTTSEEPKPIEWVKPNKTKVETNDLPANIEAALELGWTSSDKRVPSKKAK